MLLGIAFLSYYYYAYIQSPRSLPIYGNPGHKVKGFSFINQDGDTITNKDVDSTIRVVEYFFTTCKGICPEMNENMTEVYKAYRGDKGVFILSHTVDPETDTVAQLKRYADRHEADSKQWIFMTGDRKKLYDMAMQSYLVTAVDNNDYTKKVTPDFIHTPNFILVDRYNNVRGAYDGTDKKRVKQLIKDIAELKVEKRDVFIEPKKEENEK